MDDKRTKTLVVKLTSAEHEALRRVAREIGMSGSAFVREAARNEAAARGKVWVPS